MIKCTLCDREAKYRDTKPMINRNGTRYLCYCPVCKDNGLAFGFLEEEELERI